MRRRLTRSLTQIVYAMCDDLSPGHIIGTLNRICVKVGRAIHYNDSTCVRKNEMKMIFFCFLAKRVG